MSYAERHTLSATTSVGGQATVYTPALTGRVHLVEYAKTDFADGVVFTITTEGAGQRVWNEAAVNASKTVAPRLRTYSTTGGPSKYAVLGEDVEDFVCVDNERIKFLINNGGNAKAGAFAVTVI